MSYLVVKRALDIGGAAVGLVIGAVPMLLIACFVRITVGNPVLYKALRAGLHGQPFVLYKFRTMAELHDDAGQPLPDRDRVTGLGRMLRRTSLDELPQLINVLRGEMSLVGPRPLNTEYLRLYTQAQARRHEVKPGMTGLAQIRGRNRLSWDERFALDVLYVDTKSLWLDLRIVLETAVRVVRRDHITRDGDLDLPFFTGSAGRQS